MLRVARAPKIDPRGAKLRLEYDLDSQVGPKRCQVAIGVRLLPHFVDLAKVEGAASL